MTDYTVLSDEELSAEIAKRLFGLTVEWRSWDWKEDGEMGHTDAFVVVESPQMWYIPEPYASDHNASMGLVVPEMKKRPGSVIFECEATEAGSWASFRRNHAPGVSGCAESESLPRAICEAALKALEAQVHPDETVTA